VLTVLGIGLVILVVVAYWAVRRSLATPRRDGGPVVHEEGPDEKDEGEAEEEAPPPAGD
jgi:hypothetical protein